MIGSFSLAVATLAAISVAPAPAHAQKQFVGITGGATVGDFGSVSSSSRWGGTAGITLGYRNFNWSVVNIEGLWAQRGAEGLRLDYIEVPLMLGLSNAFEVTNAYNRGWMFKLIFGKSIRR